MKVARFWAKGVYEAASERGEKFKIACWRWSEESLSDATRWAKEAAEKAAKRIAAGEELLNRYEYLKSPPREEIVREIKNTNGELIATISRNSYGSLILNTKDLMFIDVDIPYERPRSRVWVALLRLLRKEIPAPAEVQIERRLRQLMQSLLMYSTRLYRTHSGFRCVVVNKHIAPDSKECRDLFARFEADPLYVRLCEAQESYRARLTPKHWRIGAKKPPSRYPWSSKADEKTYRYWEKDYNQLCGTYATCKLLEAFGTGSVDKELRALIELHDKLTLADSALRLA